MQVVLLQDPGSGAWARAHNPLGLEEGAGHGLQGGSHPARTLDMTGGSWAGVREGVGGWLRPPPPPASSPAHARLLWEGAGTLAAGPLLRSHVNFLFI